MWTSAAIDQLLDERAGARTQSRDQQLEFAHPRGYERRSTVRPVPNASTYSADETRTRGSGDRTLPGLCVSAAVGGRTRAAHGSARAS
jgi:hypothetical protein